MTNLDHMNDLFVVVQNIYGDELERIPVQPPHSLQTAMEMAADTRALLTNANVFIERPGNIDLGCPTGLTRDEREAVESPTECAYCQTEIPNINPGHPQFCSDGCKADYASEQPGYRSDREIFREEAPYGSEP